MLVAEALPICDCRRCGLPVLTKGARFRRGHNSSAASQAVPASPPGLCGCGCGKLAALGAAFIRGHSSRVVPRGADGRARPILERPLCACGQCNERVKKLGSRFLRGHNNKLRDAAGRPQRCGHCRRVIPRRRGIGYKEFCDDTCWAESQRKKRDPETALGRFVFEAWFESGLSLNAFARDIGITRESLTDLLDDRLPLRRNLDILRARYGDALPASETANDASSVRYTALLYEHGHEGRTEKAIRKRAKTVRGRAHSEERKKKIRDKLAETGGFDKFLGDSRKWSKSLEGRANLSLNVYLRHTPEPTRDEVRDWCKEVGARLGRRSDWVRAVWAQRLESRGLWRPPGPAPKKWERRHAHVDHLTADAARKADGSLADGFWPDAALLVSEQEGIQPPLSGEGLRRGYYYHLERCRCPDRRT
jgi:hypothetical protein